MFPLLYHNATLYHVCELTGRCLIQRQHGSYVPFVLYSCVHTSIQSRVFGVGVLAAHRSPPHLKLMCQPASASGAITLSHLMGDRRRRLRGGRESSTLTTTAHQRYQRHVRGIRNIDYPASSSPLRL